MTGPGGAPLFIQENHDLPLARVAVTLRHGAAEDPPGLEGLAAFAAELTRRGAAGRSRADINRALERLGAELDISVDGDSVTYDLAVLSRHLDPALAILADLILRPDWIEREAAQLGRETRAGLDELRDDDGALARRFFARQLYPDHPYGRPLQGTEASIGRLTAARARTWLERALATGNLIFGAAGDLRPDTFAERLGRLFGGLRAEAPPPADLPMPAFPRGIEFLVVDKPERTQSQILLGHPAPRWTDPDFLPLHVAATTFGGTFTARLMTEVRVKRGLSYGASARLGQGRGGRSIAVSVAPSIAQTVETIDLVLRLWRDWVERGITDDELEFAKRYLAGSFAAQVATPEDRLDLDTAALICGLAPSYRERFVAAVEAVSAEEVRRAMTRRLRPGDLAITVVSTARALRPRRLQTAIASLHVAPFDEF